jgi:hypothetical protein
MADPKILKSNPKAEAGVVVADNSVRATVNEENGLMVDERGTTIAGPMSLATSPNQIRVGGLFTFQTSVMGMLPSTMATPSAMYMVDPPVKQVVSLVKQVALMGAMIGGVMAGGAG